MKELIGALLLWVSGGRIVTKAARVEMKKAEERRARRIEHMQNRLNDDHWTRLGWKVEGGRVIER